MSKVAIRMIARLGFDSPARHARGQQHGGNTMAKQVQVQVRKTVRKDEVPADAPTVDARIAKWFAPS
jgi:hypothetical protein